MRESTTKRTIRVAALLAVAGLAMTACSTGAESKASDVQAESFAEVYAQTIDWAECGADFGMTDDLVGVMESMGGDADAFECAMIAAPFDWNDPDNSETIELAVTRRGATGDAEKLGTLFGNPGGPGASGLAYTFGIALSPGFDKITAQYDLFGFDPRGIGRSTPLECDGVSDVFEINLAVCAADQPLAASIGTSQVARDMELMRHLVNDDTLNYLGYSYGTMLGATYSTLFPENVGRMVLDSAEAAQWAGLIGSFNQQFAIATQVVELFAQCGAAYNAASCPITSEAEYLAVMDTLAAEPLLASDGSELTSSTLHGYLTTALYKRGAGRTEALETVAGVLAGDQAQIDDLVAAMTGGGASVSLAGTVVRCHSFPDDPNIIGLLDHINEMGMPVLYGGPEITDESLRPFTNLGCDALPGSGDDITDTFTGSPDATVLVVGITGDHATPYEGAQELTRQLGNARLVTLEGAGHGASFTGRSVCVDDVITGYLLSGDLPEDGLVCSDDQG
ncbi:alpha/beta hydrolase [Microbacterium sp. A196]|uniref:alpha/beta hydrolase n=1 Tax=unclassified Microbacterium TaxID=2609290 RepID=UPI003FD23058